MAVTTEIKVNPQVRTGRLVVLVPEQVENLTHFAYQVYLLSITEQLDVVYLAYDRRGTDRLPTTRTLTTLLALTEGSQVRASKVQVRAEQWSDALRQVARPGDLVLCPDEQFLAPGGTRSSGCSALEAELGITVQSLPGIYVTRPALRPWLRTALCWISGIIILVGFSFLEIRLAGVITGATKKLVLIGLTALELAIFYQWNKLFS